MNTVRLWSQIHVGGKRKNARHQIGWKRRNTCTPKKKKKKKRPEAYTETLGVSSVNLTDHVYMLYYAKRPEIPLELFQLCMPLKKRRFPTTQRWKNGIRHLTVLTPEDIAGA